MGNLNSGRSYLTTAVTWLILKSYRRQEKFFSDFECEFVCFPCQGQHQKGFLLAVNFHFSKHFERMINEVEIVMWCCCSNYSIHSNLKFKKVCLRIDSNQKTFETFDAFDFDGFLWVSLRI